MDTKVQNMHLFDKYLLDTSQALRAVIDIEVEKSIMVSSLTLSSRQSKCCKTKKEERKEKGKGKKKTKGKKTKERKKKISAGGFNVRIYPHMTYIDLPRHNLKTLQNRHSSCVDYAFDCTGRI